MCTECEKEKTLDNKKTTGKKEKKITKSKEAVEIEVDFEANTNSKHQSSTKTNELYFFANSHILSSLAIVPSIEKTPSVTITLFL